MKKSAPEIIRTDWCAVNLSPEEENSWTLDEIVVFVHEYDSITQCAYAQYLFPRKEFIIITCTQYNSVCVLIPDTICRDNKSSPLNRKGIYILIFQKKMSEKNVWFLIFDFWFIFTKRVFYLRTALRLIYTHSAMFSSFCSTRFNLIVSEIVSNKSLKTWHYVYISRRAVRR